VRVSPNLQLTGAVWDKGKLITLWGQKSTSQRGQMWTKITSARMYLSGEGI